MLLKLNEISKSFGSSSEGNLRKVLENISLQISEGESIAILGPSGSGKTTLLNIIGSLDHSDSGQVFYRDVNIAGFSEREMNSFRNSQIAYVFQLHHLLPQCTVLENILIPTLTISDKTEKKKRLERAKILIKRIGLWEQRDQKPGHLSGGECQRTAVIRAMINSPSLILADEPTGALDAENADKLADLLVEINQEDKVALIVVTHSRSLAQRMHTLYELKNGQLIQQNS